MKNTLLIVVIAIGSFVLLTSSLEKLNGSPGAKTGSPGDNGNTCTECHTGSVSMEEEWLTSNIPVTGYVPGDTYTITATGTHTGVSKFGFETTAEDSDNNKTGTFVITNSDDNKLTNSNSAVTHKSSGTNPAGDSRSWSFDWIAPEAGTGDITLYAAFNAANGNGNTSGDVIYNTTMGTTEDMNISVGSTIDIESSIRVYPNPFTDNLYINLLDLDANVSGLKVFNSIGNLIYSQDRFLDSENINISSSDFVIGIYYTVFYFDDGTKITKRIVKK